MIPSIKANWPVNAFIHGLTTLRYFEQDGQQLTFSLAHSEENNRHYLQTTLSLPRAPCWLKQVHGNQVIRAEEGKLIEADASYTHENHTVLAILTADCLPILLCHPEKKELAAIHGGWRSLASNIIVNTLATFTAPLPELYAWLGPAIGPAAFQVGPEVKEIFLKLDPALANAFVPDEKDRSLANIYEIARCLLRKQGVTQIYGGEYCTYQEETRFFSHRRAQERGRMVTLLWQG